jgi:hypothetical protein
MKKYFCFIITAFILVSCNTDETSTKGDFEFIKPYSTTIIVGGIVGTQERTFQIGEVFSGTDEGKETIKIKIAEHSSLNEDCPNSWCYQESLEVPRAHLKYQK